MKLTLLAAPGVAAAILVGWAAPAAAHVTADPSSAPKGGEVTVRFRVPNEVTDARVMKVDIAFPTGHPLLGVAVEPVPGWTPAVTKVTLSPAVQTDDGPVTQAVSEIAWAADAGAGTPPGQFQEFPVLVQHLPTDIDQVVFKVVQTYGDGTVVRWIDPVVAGQPPPDHPAPALNLTAAGGGSSPQPAGVPASASAPAAKSRSSSASTLGGIGIAVGALGVGLAAVALRRRPGAARDGSPGPGS